MTESDHDNIVTMTKIEFLDRIEGRFASRQSAEIYLDALLQRAHDSGWKPANQARKEGAELMRGRCVHAIDMALTDNDSPTAPVLRSLRAHVLSLAVP